MDIEKFTERARGFIQAAQTIAIREFHQQLAPEHPALIAEKLQTIERDAEKAPMLESYQRANALERAVRQTLHEAEALRARLLATHTR